MPRASPAGARREKTGSQSGVGRSAAAQTLLSRRAPVTIASATEDIGHRLHRLADFLVSVDERREKALVLARRDVDAPVEEAAEQLGIGIGVELGEPLDRLAATREQRQHRADALDTAERCEAVGQTRRPPLEL